MRTLCCPDCGYNLTGLPENRCPECGLRFDPQRLAGPPEETLQPIAPWVAALRCLAWVSLFWLMAFCGLATMGAPGVGFLAIAFLSVLGIVRGDSRETAMRLAIRRAVRAGHPGALLDFNPDREAPCYVRYVTLAIVITMMTAAFLFPTLVLLLPSLDRL